jgi:hypothetical protein
MTADRSPMEVPADDAASPTIAPAVPWADVPERGYAARMSRAANLGEGVER